MEGKEEFSWRKRGRSFVYAGRGIRTLVQMEHNAWIHLTVAALVIAAGFLFQLSAGEWCVVALCIGGVLAAESFNSAIEALADKVSPERDPLIGKAKDMAAGGVLLAAIGAATCGLIIFLPKLIRLIKYGVLGAVIAFAPYTRAQAQEIYYPTPVTPLTYTQTKAQKAIDTSTDVILVAMPVATLAGVLIAQDWEGLKQAGYTAAATAGATLILKFAVDEDRPDHSNRQSFPSAHTAATFANAAFLQRRYGWKLGAPAYALAAYTAFGRVFAKKHHYWDVLAGAAIGAASAYIFTTPWARKHELTVAPYAEETRETGLTTGVAASFVF